MLNTKSQVLVSMFTFQIVQGCQSDNVALLLTALASSIYCLINKFDTMFLIKCFCPRGLFVLGNAIKDLFTSRTSTIIIVFNKHFLIFSLLAIMEGFQADPFVRVLLEPVIKCS